jgi:hypothetical protein
MTDTTKLQIAWRRLDKLQGWRGNPKTHDKEGIAASITRFGFVEPVKIDARTEVVVVGHGRVEVLESMKAACDPAPLGIRVDAKNHWWVPTVPTAFDSEADAGAYLLVDNQSGMAGGWDDGLLLAFGQRMMAGDAGALTGTGFVADDLDALSRRLADGLERDTTTDDEQGAESGGGPGPSASSDVEDGIAPEVEAVSFPFTQEAHARVAAMLDALMRRERLASHSQAIVWLIHRFEDAHGA